MVAHLASNGWFAVTLAGTFEEQVAARELARLKASNEVPNDSFITYGNTYVRNVCCDGDATQMSATGQLSWEQFGVASAYSGKTALPDFKGRERAFKDFRIRIVDGMKNGPNFAGTFSVVQFGCGTGCTFVVIANNKTAELYNFPRGGEDNMYLQLNFELKSRLIVAQWSDGDNCILEDFEWIGKERKFLANKKSVQMRSVSAISKRTYLSGSEGPAKPSHSGLAPPEFWDSSVKAVPVERVLGMLAARDAGWRKPPAAARDLCARLPMHTVSGAGSDEPAANLAGERPATNARAPDRKVPRSEPRHRPLTLRIAPPQRDVRRM